MFTALHHITLATRDLPAATDGYAKLFGRQPTVRDKTYSWLPLDNIALRLEAHESDALASITFATHDLAKARHVLQRRGIAVSDCNLDSEPALTLSREATHGVAIRVIESKVAPKPLPAQEPVVSGLDHIVITTSHPERAAALYGARLGLDMKLDRTNPDWGSRLMFFRCGELIVEIAHSLKNADPNAPDVAWGLSWRVVDIAAAQSRLKSEGFDVSDIRAGRKPGTAVFTVRDAPANVPTIFIGPLV